MAFASTSREPYPSNVCFSENKTKSLLMKYNIPVSHLSYEYVRSCTDVKELERILKILKSGEEGFYPNLQKEAEDKLRSFSPNNILIREEVPVLTKESISKEELKYVLEDLSNWEEDIVQCDQRLSKGKFIPDNNDFLVPIREIINTTCAQNDTPDKAPLTLNKICDYTSWDKYDVDSELLKMDLEEEKQKDIKQQKKSEPKQNRLEIIIQQAEKYTESERKLLAEQEIVRGNEYYKVGDFEEAIKCYTASIIVWDTARAHNNRAACYLTLRNYSAVLEDTDSVLTLEPGNTKALYRRSIAKQKRKLFIEAFEDIKEVLKKQPANVEALKVAEELKNEVQHLSEATAARVSCDYLKPDMLEKCYTNGRSRVTQSLPPPTNTVKIVELSEDPQPSKMSTKLEIIEVE